MMKAQIAYLLWYKHDTFTNLYNSKSTQQQQSHIDDWVESLSPIGLAYYVRPFTILPYLILSVSLVQTERGEGST